MQYSREEYERLVPIIIETMRSRGEWGEFFPASLSPIAYNHSVAQRYFPLTKDDVSQMGLRWFVDHLPEAPQAIEAELLPDELLRTDETIIVRSVHSGHPFKITSQEIRKYRQFQVPLPRTTYDERMEERIKILGGVHLYDRSCATCQKPISTSYSPERPEKVVCEECYLKEVY
jgi:hypothetical protein